MEQDQAADVEREQLFLYGPDRTRCDDDPSKVFRHLQRYMLAMIHCLPLEKREAYLDYGCGSGYGTELIGTYFHQKLGVDQSQEAIEYAKKNHSRSGVVYGNVDTYFKPLLSGTFDFITCIEMVEHMEATEAYALLDKLRDLLDPNGTLVLTTPLRNPEGKPNPHHLHEYTQEELENVLGNRFNVVEIQDISMGLPNLIAICREPKK